MRINDDGEEEDRLNEAIEPQTSQTRPDVSSEPEIVCDGHTDRQTDTGPWLVRCRHSVARIKITNASSFHAEKHLRLRQATRAFSETAAIVSDSLAARTIMYAWITSGTKHLSYRQAPC